MAEVIVQLFRIGIIQCVASILLLAGTLVEIAPAVALEEGAPVPDISVQTIEGATISLASLRGKYVYLDFWASWCPPCRIALPFLNTLREKFTEHELAVVAVNVDEDLEAAKTALKGISPKFIVVRDENQRIVSQFNPPKMPSSYLIAPDGKVALVHQGFAERDKEMLVSRIGTLLAHRGGDEGL